MSDASAHPIAAAAQGEHRGADAKLVGSLRKRAAAGAIRFATVLSAVPLLSACAFSLGGAPAPLHPGQRVRVTAPSAAIDQRPLVLRDVRGDAVVFAGGSGADSAGGGQDTSGGDCALPLEAITRFEVAVQGLGAGYLVGLLAGGGLGWLAMGQGCHDGGPLNELGNCLRGTVGVGIGAAVGSMVGNGAFPRWEWMDVPVWGVRVADVAPPAGGARSGPPSRSP